MTRDNPQAAPEKDDFRQRCQSSTALSHLQRPTHTRRGPCSRRHGEGKRAFENPILQPRAYRLAYSKDLHALLNEGMKKARQGVSQMGQAVPKAGKKGLGWLRPGSDEQEVKISDLPAPQLPEK